MYLVDFTSTFKIAINMNYTHQVGPTRFFVAGLEAPLAALVTLAPVGVLLLERALPTLALPVVVLLLARGLLAFLAGLAPFVLSDLSWLGLCDLPRHRQMCRINIVQPLKKYST